MWSTGYSTDAASFSLRLVLLFGHYFLLGFDIVYGLYTILGGDPQKHAEKKMRGFPTIRLYAEKNNWILSSYTVGG